MADGLKIYACSGFGGVGATGTDFNYWLDNTETVTNTCAVNVLLAQLNLLFTELQYDTELSDEEILYSLNLIDLYAVCLQFAKNQRTDTNELSRAGRIIAQMVEDGEFNYNSLDNDERDKNLDMLIATAETLFLAGENPTVNNEFYRWYIENVLELNYQGLTEEQQRAAREVIVKNGEIYGIGATEQDAGTYLNKSGAYHIYEYIDNNTLKKLPKKIQWKEGQQQKMYSFTQKVYAPLYGGKKASVDSVLYAGFCSTYKGTPKAVIKSITGGNAKSELGVGIATQIIVAIISAVVSIIIAVITAICEYAAKAVQVKYSEPENAKAAVATDDDLADIDAALGAKTGSGNGSGNSSGNSVLTADMSKYLKWGLIGTAIYMIIKKIK